MKIDYSKPVDALVKVDGNMAVLGGASMSSADWLDASEKAGNKIANKNNLIFYKIMEEEIVVVVNSANGISALSAEQLKDIFSGKTVNWKDVGGSDAPILVVWPTAVSGGTELFSKKILKGASITKENLEVKTIGHVAEPVVANVEAIGIMNKGAVDPKCKVIASPSLIRPLTLVSNGKLPAPAQKLVDFLMGEGQQYFKK